MTAGPYVALSDTSALVIFVTFCGYQDLATKRHKRPCVCRARAMLLLTQEVTSEVDKAREAVAGIDVVLDDVEREVVGTAEGPDRENEQKRGLKRRVGQQDGRGREQAQQKEQGAFEVQEFWVLDVWHGSSLVY